MNTYEIWMEGAATNGDGCRAQMVGVGQGNDFVHACVRYYLGEAGNGLRMYRMEISPEGVPSVWGCRFFDNEADARASFG